MTDLTPAIDFSQSEVLNGKIENLQDIFTDGEGLLISEDDAQMIIKLTFKEIVKMKTFKIVSLEDDVGPSVVKLYVNQPGIDFMTLGDFNPSETICYANSSEVSEEGKSYNLPFSKFNKVLTLAIFIEDNIRGSDETFISKISLQGTYDGAVETKSGGSGNSGSNVKQPKSEIEYNELKAKSGLIVVDFSASWCPPCKMIAPYFDELSLKHTDVTFIKLDIDHCKSYKDTRDVQSVPTFKFFKNNSLVEVISGANKASLTSAIEKLK